MAISLDDLFIDEDGHLACDKSSSKGELDILLANLFVEWKKRKNVVGWIAYDFDKPETRPKEYGKYFIHRKDGKVHWETWNNSGWAYNEKVITHWKEVTLP